MSSNIPGNPFKSQTSEGESSASEEPSLSAPFGNPEDEDTFSFDLSGYTGNSIVAPGTYAARVTDLLSTQSRKGDPMWTWTFEIIGNPDGSPSAYNGRTLRNHTTLSEAALFKMVESVEALGLGKQGGNMKFKKADALDRMCYLEVTAGEYEGQKTNNVKKVHPYNPLGQKFTRGSVGI